MTSLDKLQTKLSALFEKEGFKYVDLPLLYKSETFSNLLGSDISRRLYRTKAADGTEYCLRPDFTTPIAKHYVENVKPGKATEYYYSGPIFRQRPEGIGEIQQLGAEIIGDDKKEHADARIISLALKVATESGIKKPVIKIGDEALFTAVVKELGLPIPWQRRFHDKFGDRAALDAAIERMVELSNSSGEAPSYVAALEHPNSEATVALVEHILALSGISVVGGRTAKEIAERYIEQAKLSYSTKIDAEKSGLLAKFLDIRSSAAGAVKSLQDFEKEAGISLKNSISMFQKRLEQMVKLGIDAKKLEFAADFGRSQSYYTGFMFEFYAQKAEGSRPFAGGGRYDKLFQLMDVKKEVPAVGFTLWLERLN